MDQIIFNWIVGACGVLGGWTLKVIWDSLQELRKDVRTLDTKMHEDFVRRDDFKEAVKEIKDDMKAGFSQMDKTLGLLFKKIEGKVDK